VTARVTILMPRLNANDDNGVIVRWFKTPGQRTARGDQIAQIETTKATVDIEADAEGYFFPLADAGARPAIGAPIAWITSTYDHDALVRERDAAKAEISKGPRLASRKALELMAKVGLEVNDIPGTGPISADDVEKAHAARRPARGMPLEVADTLAVDERSVVLFGAAEQGLVVLDCFLASAGFSPVCFIDDRPSGSTLAGLPVFTPDTVPTLRKLGVRYAHICIGAPAPRLRTAAQLKEQGFEIIQAIHPKAIVSPAASIGEGAYVGPGVVVGPEVIIGDYSQVNNNSTIPHHVRIGMAVRVSDGANIAGGVTIGDRTLLGLGVTVNTGCDIGADVTIVSGVSIFDKVPDNAIVRITLSKH
jgi:UDP-perosamine 4-acetyltransferase